MTLFSMNEITTYRWSFEEDVANYREAGYNAIGVWRHKLGDCGEERAIDVLAGSGLEVTHLAWAGGFTGGEGGTFAENIADAQEALRLAAGMRAGCLVVHPGGRNNHTFRHAGRLLRTALEELLPLAAAVEVPIAIEPIQAACAGNWTFLTDNRSALSLLDEFESPYLKIALDTYHYPVSGFFREDLKQVAKRLGIVHLSDCRGQPSLEQERCPLGRGLLPLRDIIGTLQDAGYTGAYDIKLMGTEIESTDYWSLLEHAQFALEGFVPAFVSSSVS